MERKHKGILGIAGGAVGAFVLLTQVKTFMGVRYYGSLLSGTVISDAQYLFYWLCVIGMIVGGVWLLVSDQPMRSPTQDRSTEPPAGRMGLLEAGLPERESLPTAQVTDISTCTKCGFAGIRRAMKFCTACGSPMEQRLDEAKGESAGAESRCTQCQALLRVEDHFCAKCGAPAAG